MTTADTAAERADVPHRGLIARHPLVFFFLLSFVFSWSYWGLHKALQLPGPLFALGAAGPLASALMVLAITSGKPGVLALLRRYVHWRIGLQWYLVTLIGVQVLMFLSLWSYQGPLLSLSPRIGALCLAT